MEKQIKALAKMYECRDTARRFYRDEYQTKIEPYKEILNKVMQANKCNEIEALVNHISKENVYNENPMAQMLFIAAVVEVSEAPVTH